MKKYFQNAGDDFSASIVIFLVALPLCLGIALGSGAPLFSGLIAGIIGGIVVGFLSGSQLSVSGPAAGLSFIVAASIIKLQAYEAFLLAVVLAGTFQWILGSLNAGIIGDYVPNSVIKGMLAAIGFILILKQVPHLIGYDADFIGDETFSQSDNKNTFTEILQSFEFITPSALIIGVSSLFILWFWESKLIKAQINLHKIPGPLLAVITGVLINGYFKMFQPGFALESKHLVLLPVINNSEGLAALFTFPKASYLFQPNVWFAAITIALIASLETLIGIEAIDKLDPLKRVTPPNRELKAQGIGNILSGLIGGIPLTSVVVRSSANITAGAKTKVSTIIHGCLLLICVLLIPSILNLIPLSALAAILIYTGFKLARVSMFKDFYNKGWDQFVPFVGTIIAILLTDLLIGIITGIIIGLFFMVRSNFRSAILFVEDKNHYLIRFKKDVSFLNKPIVKKKLESIPKNAYLLFDPTRADFIDKDIIEEVNDFMLHAHLKNIKIEIKKSASNPKDHLFNEPQNPTK